MVHVQYISYAVEPSQLSCACAMGPVDCSQPYPHRRLLSIAVDMFVYIENTSYKLQFQRVLIVT